MPNGGRILCAGLNTRVEVSHAMLFQLMFGHAPESVPFGSTIGLPADDER
jgi:hypothetical protein